MLSVDLENREICASVRALAAWPPDPPRPAGWLARARVALGNEVHRRYRLERTRTTPGFLAEVAVSLTHEVDGFRVRLTGRADGVIRNADEVVVEEVKSVGHPAVQAAHAFQLRLYALCLARAADAVRGRLLLVTANDETRSVDVDCDPGRTERELEARLRAVIEAARAGAARARARAALAEELRFPYARLRPGQERLVAAIAEGLEAGRPVLALAPTGSGKTVCALLAALRFALSRNAALFFATAKTTQQELVARTFRDVAEGRPLRSLTLRAKARMCPPQTLLCHPDHCSHLARFLDASRRTPVLERLGGDAVHTHPDAVFQAGQEAELCPYALALTLARDMDLVIGDYNYVYGPASLETERDTVVVLDEAHNLFDRARQYDSPFLDRRRLRDLNAPRDFAPYLAALDAFLAEDEPADAQLDELADEALRLTVRYAQKAPIRPDDALLDVLQTVCHLRDLTRAGEPELVPYATERGRGIFCVNPARRLAERHQRRLGTVAMSATLTPLGYFRDVLGFGPLDPLEIEHPSPFPENHRCVVVTPTVSTTWRERPRHYGAIARLIARVVAVQPGHYVAYLPSFRFLEAVRAEMTLPALVQRPGMTVDERQRLLERLQHDPEPLLLLAVTGGSFAEGIDLPGAGLIGAIVVGPGLPQVGLERTAMRNYFEATTRQGFAHAMLYPGMQRVIQSAGRVHRTPDDKGVIVLLDRRFTQKPYAACLPPHWHATVTDDPVPVLEAFWGNGRG
ncbi:MAG: helicase C-terminal domain-containing protein [Planctomycetota bacterium]|jgi:DNA excision repair protein ERCC-2